MKLINTLSFIAIIVFPVTCEVFSNLIYKNLRNVTFEEQYAKGIAHKIYDELTSWYFTLVCTKNDTFENSILKNIENIDDGFPVMMMKDKAENEPRLDKHGKTTYIVTYPVLSLKVADDLITTLKNVGTWKPRSNVVFILKFPVKITKYYMYDLKQHFNLLWSRRIVNTILILWSSGLKVYTFNPFTDEVMDITKQSPITKVLEKKFSDMNGYPLRVTQFRKLLSSKKKGPVDCKHSLISTFVKYLNATCVTSEPRDHGTVGILYENGTATGATAELIDGLADIELNSRILKLQYYGFIDTTYPLTEDDLVFLVPKGKKQDSFTALLKFLPVSTLLFLIVIMISNIMLALLFRDLEKRWFGVPQRRGTGSVAMDLLKCFVRQSVIIRFSGVAFRILVFAIEMYSLVVDCAIDGVLVTAITYPSYYADINTLTELAQSNYKVVIHKRHLDLIEKYLDKDMAVRAVVPSEEEIVKLVEAKSPGYAYLLRSSDADYVRRQKMNMLNERPFYHKMAESAIPCLIVYGLRHGSPYLPRVDRFMSSLSQSGLLTYWDRVKSYSLYNYGQKALYEGAARAKAPLDMENTNGIFYVWITGVIVSIIVFTLEVLYPVIVLKINKLSSMFKNNQIGT